ncbi:hypothetical protein MLD38_018974 [Melastoma candidum]|uniref:Uncharacterized protein n=1 Tax=Melastoma candidum TaxID=119954 RepID=A0ACB9QVG0_9MYRT|nr:hypothetical protein MLD38_018974 [Melastoma candidum]
MWPSNRAKWPNSLSLPEKVVLQEHLHLFSPQCLRWLLRSARMEKFLLLQRLQEYIFGAVAPLEVALDADYGLEGAKTMDFFNLELSNTNVRVPVNDGVVFLIEQ